METANLANRGASPSQIDAEKVIPLFEVPAQHDGHDLGWLEALDVPVDNIDPQSLDLLVQLGSRPLNCPSHNETVTGAVVEARRAFFDLIGYPEGSSVRTTIEKTNPLLVPTDSVVESIRTQHSIGLDVKRIVRIYPRSLYMSQDELYNKVGILQSFGVYAVKALNRQPKLLSMAEKNTEEKMELFESLGLNGVRMIDDQPTVIAYSKENIFSTVNYIRRIMRLWGKSEEEATLFVEDNSQILGNSKSNLKTRARIISSTSGSPIRLSLTDAIGVPVESLLFARTMTSDTADLFQIARKHQRDHKTAQERRDDIDRLLTSSDVRSSMGKKVVRAYEIYRRTSPRS